MSKLNRASAGAIFSACMVGNAIDGNAIGSQIKWLATTGPKLDATIHAVATAAIAVSLPHSEGGHNNHETAAKLVQTIVDLNKSGRAKSLAAWINANSNVRVRIEKGGKVTSGILTPKSKQYRAGIDPMASWDRPFWSVEERAPSEDEYRFGDKVARFLATAKKNVDTMSDADKAAFAALEAALPTLTATPKKAEADA